MISTAKKWITIQWYLIPVVVGILLILALTTYFTVEPASGPQIVDVDDSDRAKQLASARMTDIVSSSPENGESNVAVNRETILEFNQPVSFAGEKTDIVSSWFAGRKLESRLRLSPNKKIITLFYSNPLPDNARILVRIDGSGLIGESGKPIDAVGDGKPGGVATIAFDTLSLTRIPGTEVWGYVFDSYQKNPDGSDVPVVGATIRVDGLAGADAVTDEKGYFVLEDVPAPVFFAHIDGSTATNHPPGSLYATVGKALHSLPGQSVQLSMDGQSFNIYLPTMSKGDIQGLSQSSDTDVKFGAAGKTKLEKMFPAIDSEVWNQTRVTFPPNSAVDESGNPATEAAIIPVPATRLPAPLPPGANHQLDVAVMAGDATNFETPAPACFPNLPDPVTGKSLPPGEKSALWSYNHDTGRWEINGQMTVSADGSMVCTNPGVGIRAPGWHGTNPGSVAKGGDIFVDEPPKKGSGVVKLKVDNLDPDEDVKESKEKDKKEQKPAKIIGVGYYIYVEGERVEVEQNKLPYFTPIFIEVEFDAEPSSEQRILNISDESFTLEDTDKAFVLSARIGILTPPLGEPMKDSE